MKKIKSCLKIIIISAVLLNSVSPVLAQQAKIKAVGKVASKENERTEE